MSWLDAEVKRMNRRTERERQTPLVIYRRSRGSYGTARLANVGDYMTLHGHHGDYSTARIIDRADDLVAIAAAKQAIMAANRAADSVYARAFGRGRRIKPSEAEAARIEE